MKLTARKSLLAIAVGVTLASTAFAQTAPSVTFYGRLDLGVESANDGALTKTMLQNFASRFGIKGDRSFSSDLSGIFQVETGIAPDDTAQSKSFASRNSFVGLKSNSAGTFLVGTYDTPLKSLDAGGYAGTLYGEGEAMEVIIHGKGTATVGTTTFDNVHIRQKNNLVYISPKFADIVVKASYSPDEAQTATVNQPLYSVSAEWNDGTYNVGLATLKKNAGLVYGMSATKLTVGAKMGDFTAGLAFSALDNNAVSAADARKTNNSLVVLGYTMGATVFKFNYGMSGESASNAQDDLTMASVEVNYALDKQTTLYSNYAQITNNARAKGELVGSDSKVSPASAGNDPTALTFGIRYNF